MHSVYHFLLLFMTCNWILTRVTRCVITLPDHLRYIQLFVRIVLLCLYFSMQHFIDHYLSVCSFSFGPCIICAYLIYDFCLFLLYCKYVFTLPLPDEIVISFSHLNRINDLYNTVGLYFT